MHEVTSPNPQIVNVLRLARKAIVLGALTAVILVCACAAAQKEAGARPEVFTLWVIRDAAGKTVCSVHDRPPVSIKDAMTACKSVLMIDEDMSMYLQVAGDVPVRDLNAVLQGLARIGWRDITLNGMLRGRPERIETPELEQIE